MAGSPAPTDMRIGVRVRKDDMGFMSEVANPDKIEATLRRRKNQRICDADMTARVPRPDSRKEGHEFHRQFLI